MPQLDFQWFASQFFWLAIIFVGLYLILSRFTLPRLGKVIEGRNEKIGAELARAESLRKEAEGLERQYRTELERVHADANKMIAKASADAAAEAHDKNADLDKVIAKKLAEAEKKIRAGKEKTLKELEEGQIQITKLILNKVASINIDDAAVKNALKSAGKNN